MKYPSVTKDTLLATTADQCSFLPRQIMHLLMGLDSPSNLSFPVSTQVEVAPALIAVARRMSFLETGTKIVQTLGTKTLPSNTCSAIDKPVRVFPQMELVDDLHRTCGPKNKNNLRAPDTVNSGKNQSC